ncbi:hypothetical protein IEQ34_026725 [Dendrobium chrysotoxum]|uniref:MI domain-containing protein n=1 Tax=Dendrobium chrysotoxum TaxID=161865 RepID=A0AAV7FLJ7_DENCH|nr:hypothetical protein IEQ34_026725 [Dendrobium chrysotoxum]
MVLAVNEHGAVTPIVEEYFTTGDVDLATSDLRDLDLDEHHHYFIKKQISTVVDRHAKEKEMALALPSALYADVISASHISHGFIILLGSAEDLAIDVLDAVEVLALFVARVIVDGITLLHFSIERRKCFREILRGLLRLLKRALFQLLMQS